MTYRDPSVPQRTPLDEGPPPGGVLQAMVTKGVAGSLMRLLRVPPQQKRAIDTVDRLLGAGFEALIRSGMDGCTVEAAAEAANISKQLAYRYVADTPTMQRAVVRWWQGRNILVFRRMLEEGNFSSDAALAAHLVTGIVSRFPRGNRMSYAILRVLARDYHEIDYAQIVHQAALLRLAMQRCGLEQQSLSDEQLVTALAALAGAIKMTFITDRDLVFNPAHRAGLERIFLTMLRG